MSATAVRTDLPFPRNYADSMLCFRRGEGVYLEDTEGRRYLDLGAGIAVNALGYGRSDLADIAAEQMKRLIHVSNLFTTEPALELGRVILADANSRLASEYAAVHFGNSGTEANEAAFKYARLYAARTRGPGHHAALVLEHGFHGRTMGALSLTPTRAYQEAFAPLVPDVVSIPHNDVAALEATLDDRFAVVFVEVVQGEGGLSVLSPDFVGALNRLCRKHDVILVADEVQTGLGRTGRFFASELVGLTPDIITLSKPLAGGLPLSATLIPKRINDLLLVGDHGSTFGGGPVTAAVAREVWRIVSDEDFLDGVRRKAGVLQDGLARLVESFDCAQGLVGAGLLRGLVVDQAERSKAIIAAAREVGLLVLRSGTAVLRLAPPLVITEGELEEGLALLETAIRKTI